MFAISVAEILCRKDNAELLTLTIRDKLTEGIRDKLTEGLHELSETPLRFYITEDGLIDCKCGVSPCRLARRPREARLQ